MHAPAQTKDINPVSDSSGRAFKNDPVIDSMTQTPGLKHLDSNTWIQTPGQRRPAASTPREKVARSTARCDRRLPCSKRTVSILQMWCTLCLCMSMSTAFNSTMGPRRVIWPRKRRRQKRRPLRRKRNRPRHSFAETHQGACTTLASPSSIAAA